MWAQEIIYNHNSNQNFVTIMFTGYTLSWLGKQTLWLNYNFDLWICMRTNFSNIEQMFVQSN